MPSEAVADIAVIGLAVMGQNLILNIDDHGFVVCAFNRTVSKVTDFLNNEAKDTKIVGAQSLEEMVKLLKRPRRIVILVKAGSAVQTTIDSLVPLLDKGDIIIDGGNSEYHDSNRRAKELAAKGLLCWMWSEWRGRGCSLWTVSDAWRWPEAWPHIKPIFQSIAAKSDGEPCCDWLGEAGSGHFVKMVHNGIEYGDMQLISEAYHLLHSALQLGEDEMADVFDTWNKGELDSFLIEITANILRFKDEKGQHVVPQIKDTAGQKGTGKWTGLLLWSMEPQSHSLRKPPSGTGSVRLQSCELCQGFMLLAEASNEFSWKLDFGAIALMWRGGCIIRSRFLGRIKEAFEKNPKLVNLLLDDFFLKAINDAQQSWREVLPANLIQAQRDYFGAHTYELLASPGKFVHTNWTGHGGRVTSNAYSA
uniref:6-phosphogluconate dehydrogenase, decarboxylating n=1 Tax=Ditylenchus dipsaci TaxID=166011 RepID=A0A915E2Q1_9BILA